MPRAELAVVLAAFEDDPIEVMELVREVLHNGISPREVQALLARSVFLTGQRAMQAEDRGLEDVALQYRKMQARDLETLRKTVADHEDAIGIERVVFVVQTQAEALVDAGPGDLIPVE